MGKGHFVSNKEVGFDWKGFQEHMGYSDEELKALQDNPVKSKYVQQICSTDMQDKYLVAEVIESHGCIAGMKPGDRIYFKGMSILDPERSDPWCPYIANTYVRISGARNMFTMGLDPSNLMSSTFGCLDVGPENGLGRVIYKVFVVDKSELD